MHVEQINRLRKIAEEPGGFDIFSEFGTDSYTLNSFNNAWTKAGEDFDKFLAGGSANLGILYDMARIPEQSYRQFAQKYPDHPLAKNWEALVAMGNNITSDHDEHASGTVIEDYSSIPFVGPLLGPAASRMASFVVGGGDRTNYYRPRDNWTSAVLSIWRNPLTKQLTGAVGADGSIDPQKLIAIYQQDPAAVTDYINQLNGFVTNKNYEWMRELPQLQPLFGNAHMLAAVQHLLNNTELAQHWTTLQNLTGQSEDDTIDDNEFMDPANLPAIRALHAAASNPETLVAMRMLDPDTAGKIEAGFPKLNWALQNRDSLIQLNDFRANPLAYLLTSLFNRDPSNLYSIIDNIGKMYHPTTDADFNWYRYLVHGNPDMQQYGKYLPWLRLIGNVRSLIGGTGTRYE